MFIFKKWETSNNVISHSYRELKGIDGEKESIERRRIYSIELRILSGMKHYMYAFKSIIILFIVQNQL